MNWEPIVVAWALVGLIGLGFSVNLAVEDYHYFGSMRLAVQVGRLVAWGPRWWLSLGFLGANVLFCAAWAVIVLVGIISISLPPLVSERRQAAEEITGWMFIGMEIALAGIQVWWQVVRAKTRVFKRTDLMRPSPSPIERQSLETSREGRPMLHAINGDLQLATGSLDVVAATAALTDDEREVLADAVECLIRVSINAEAVQKLVQHLDPEYIDETPESGAPRG